MASKFCILFICLFFSSSCSLLKFRKENPPVQPTLQLETEKSQTLSSEVVNPSVSSKSDDSSSSLKKGMPDSDEFEDYKKVVLSFEEAILSFKSEVAKSERGVVVQSSSSDCEVGYRVVDETLYVQAYSKKPNCTFTVSTSLKEAVPLEVQLKKGRLVVENWSADLNAKVDWGDISLSDLQDVDLTCGYCMLTGQGISGKTKFQIENGNVGLENLESSVFGRTLGDIVLKWKKFSKDSNVNIETQAGDVILALPEKVALNLDLVVLRGEIFSKLDSYENGVPVHAKADLGNVRVFREK